MEEGVRKKTLDKAHIICAIHGLLQPLSLWETDFLDQNILKILEKQKTSGLLKVKK